MLFIFILVYSIIYFLLLFFFFPIDIAALPWKSKILFNTQVNVHKYLISTKHWWSTIFRTIFNILIRFAIYQTEKSPFLAYLMFGKNKSHLNIYKFHYE